MIAYKVFRVIENKLYPCTVYDFIDYYPIGYIHTRADNCGPFACFATFEAACWFRRRLLFLENYFVIYKVIIKKSRARSLWLPGGIPLYSVPQETIFADEFQILEEAE